MFTDINLNTVKYEDIISSGVDSEFLLGIVDDKKLKAYIEIKRYFGRIDRSKYQQYIFETNVKRSVVSDSSTIILCLDKDDIYENISKLPFNTLLEDDPVDATIYIAYNKCCVAKIYYRGTAVDTFTVFDGEPDFVEIRIILDGYTIPLEQETKQPDLASIFATPVLVFDKRKILTKNPNIIGIVDFGSDSLVINYEDNLTFVPMKISKPDSTYNGTLIYVATIIYTSGYTKIEAKITLRRKKMYPDCELELVFNTLDNALTLMNAFGLCNVYYNGKAYKISLFTKEGFDNVYRPDEEHN